MQYKENMFRSRLFYWFAFLFTIGFFALHPGIDAHADVTCVNFTHLNYYFKCDGRYPYSPPEPVGYHCCSGNSGQESAVVPIVCTASSKEACEWKVTGPHWAVTENHGPDNDVCDGHEPIICNDEDPNPDDSCPAGYSRDTTCDGVFYHCVKITGGKCNHWKCGGNSPASNCLYGYNSLIGPYWYSCDPNAGGGGGGSPTPITTPPPIINSFRITNVPMRAFSGNSKNYYLILKSQAGIYNLNLEWSTDYASSCSGGCESGAGRCSPGWAGGVGTSGSKKVKNVPVTGEHVYTLTCSGAGGSTTAKLRVIVKTFSWFEIIPRISLFPQKPALANIL